MAHRKIHPEGAVTRRCDVCGFVTVKLTDREWDAKRRIHDKISLRHQDALKRAASKDVAALATSEGLRILPPTPCENYD